MPTITHMAIAQYLADVLSVSKYALITHSVPSGHVEFHHAHSSLSSRFSDAIVLWSG